MPTRPSLRRALLPLFGALLLAPPCLAAAGPRVADVRVGQHPTFTRIVFELDRPAGYGVARAQSPDGAPELVVSLAAQAEAGSTRSWSRLVRRVDVRPSGSGTRAHIRLAERGLVVKELILPDPPRLVLDVMREADLRTAAAPEPTGAGKASGDAAPAEETAEAPKTPPERVAKARPTAPEPEAASESTPAGACEGDDAGQCEAKPEASAAAEPQRPRQLPRQLARAPRPMPSEPSQPSMAAGTDDGATAGTPANAATDADASEDAEPDAVAVADAGEPDAAEPPDAAGSDEPQTAAVEGASEEEVADEGDDAALAAGDGEEADATAVAHAEPPTPLRPAEPQPAEPERARAPAPAPAPDGGSWMDTLGPALAGVAVLALVVLVALALRRRRGRARDDMSVVPDDEPSPQVGRSVAQALASSLAATEAARKEREDGGDAAADLFADSEEAEEAGEAPGVAGADDEWGEMPAEPGGLAADRASEPADRTPEPDASSESLFGPEAMTFEYEGAPGGSPDDDEKEETAMETQVTQHNPDLQVPVSSGASSDVAALVQALDRRVSQLESRLEEAQEARAKLERQVASQAEELRVQRAAIARTQRALRSLNRPEDLATEPAPKADA